MKKQRLRRTRKLWQYTNWKVNLRMCELAKASRKENWSVQLVCPAGPSSWSVQLVHLAGLSSWSVQLVRPAGLSKHVAICTCCQLQVLPVAHVASCTCCLLHVLPVACVASRKCCHNTRKVCPDEELYTLTSHSRRKMKEYVSMKISIYSKKFQCSHLNYPWNTLDEIFEPTLNTLSTLSTPL